MTRPHSKLGPSSTSRWFHCPGSVALIDKLKSHNKLREKVSKAAQEGQVAHLHLERCTKEIYNEKSSTQFENGLSKMPSDIRNCVEFTLTYLADTTRALKANKVCHRTEVNSEIFCSLERYKIEGMEGGTADLVIRGFDENEDTVFLEIIDYKHGVGTFVPVEDNNQLRMYALGIIDEIEPDKLKNLTVYTTIIQPRYFGDAQKVRTNELDIDELYDWRDKILLPKARKAMSPGAPLRVSDESCKWCPARIHCPELVRHTLELASQEFLSDASSLTMQQRKSILQVSKVIPEFIREVVELCQEDMINGAKCYDDTHKLVKASQRKKWQENAEKILNSWLTGSELYDLKLKPVSQVTANLEKELGIEQTKKVLKQVLIYPVDKLIIAPRSDSRKAQEPSLIDDFAEIEGEN